jgi:hypothetical protein
MVRIIKSILVLALLAVVAPAAVEAQQYGQAKKGKDAKIKEALSAAPEELAKGAAVMDWDQTVLRQGTNGYTCMPTSPDLPGEAPMCLDEQWMKWAHAWMNKQDLKLTGVGVAYMFKGDEGASNTDPYATDATKVSDWVVGGPHLMVIVPDAAQLNSFPDDYTRGIPWVMWKGTPYAHIMVPLGNHEMGQEHNMEQHQH